MEQIAGNSDPLSLLSLTIPASFHGVRLDHYLVQVMADISRSQIIASIKSGGILVNGASVKAGYSLKSGDTITGALNDPLPDALPEAQPVDFTVLYEDADLLIIDKPAGLVVHPGSGNRDKTLINGLLFHYRDLAGVGDRERPGIVHRLDKDTSGVMVVARTLQCHQKLVQLFKERQVEKHYLALVHGIPDTEYGRIVSPIGRHPVYRQKMAVRPSGGRYAASNWRVHRYFDNCCLLEVHIETGRTHQIRVHLASIGHPVAGDRLYGSNRSHDQFPRQMLHAWRLQLNHPENGQLLAVESPLPSDFTEVIGRLEKI